MTITLFPNRNLGGNQPLTVAGDIADLRNTPVGNSTSSISMDDSADIALFFTGRNWTDRVMFRNAVTTINNVGRPNQGGRRGFNNSIRSVRVTPFTVQAHFHVIRSGPGGWPGPAAAPVMSDDATAAAYCQAVAAATSAVWAQGLIQIAFNGFNVYDNPRFFNMRRQYVRLVTANNLNIQPGMANVFLVNGIAGASGVSLPRRLSNRIILQTSAPAAAGVVLAHEIGHFFGIHHQSAGGNASNVMNPGAIVGPPVLSDRQIERVHRNLARGEAPRRNTRIE